MTDHFTSRFLDARRAYIRSRFPHLNPMQQEAVLQTEGPLLILAGAGSGKTTVLINRIYNLLKYGSGSDSELLPPFASEDMIRELEEHGPLADEYAAMDPVPPWQILAITFTNKAAGELKTRLETLLGESSRDIWACTFHSACVRILRRDCDRLGFTRDFTIYDTSDSLSLIKHILKDQNLDEKYYPPRGILSEISRAKGDKVLPPEFCAEAKKTVNLHRQQIGEIYTEYVRRLSVSDAMDFDDLLLFTVMLLSEHEDVLDYWQRRFRYVLIDEYQDTNLLQYELSSLIAGKYKNICVVGDDDQSIYKFRGATIENILSFEERYQGCRCIRLEQNYRSTGHILDAANAVIRNNTERKGKELWTDKPSGDLIELYTADSEKEEAQYVASKMLAGYSKGANWRDFAVLYRKNAQSNSIEFALKRNGIPYRIFGGTRFFDRAEVKDILSYLSVVSSPGDNLRLERIINTPARGIGSKSIEVALSLAAEEGKTLFDVISHADRYEDLARPAMRMRAFATLIEELRAFSEVNTPDLLFDEIIEKTGYIRALKEKNTQEDLARAENVEELKTSILTYMRESGDTTLAGYLANVALYTDLDNYDTSASAVTLMTMHSSKGLEFPHVFIIGMEETIFPSMQAIGESAEMEEERRLCYVAITRAMQSLHLVCARERMIFGKTTSNRVSRFVDEIPEEDIHKNVPKGYGYRDAAPQSYHQRSESGYGSGYNSSSIVRRPVQKGFDTHTIKLPVTPKTEQKPLLQLSVGDAVRHQAFHEGTVVKITPMGNDALLEIDFLSVGKKKLMLRTASLHMEKL